MATNKSKKDQSNPNSNSTTLQGMMDIIDPAFEGADGIDGDYLLQALSDHEDLMDFHGDDDDHHSHDHGLMNSSTMNVSGDLSGGGISRQGSDDVINGITNRRSSNRSQGSGGGGGGGGRGGYNRMNSGNRSCSIEPFMLDSDFYSMNDGGRGGGGGRNNGGGDNGGGGGNNYNGGGGRGNNNNAGENVGGNLLIGTTIKAPLAPLEPTGGNSTTRGRTKRAPRRKARSRSNSSDAHMQLFNELPPLFGGGGGGGGGRGARSVGGSVSGDIDFGDAGMFGCGDDRSDVASACSAPADLFEFGGLYNNTNDGGGGGMGGGGNNNNDYDPTAIPDIMDIQKMMIMRGLLDEGGDLDGGNSMEFNEFRPQQIQRSHLQNQQQQQHQQGGGRQPMRRRNTVDGLANSLDSQGSGNSRMEEEMTAQNNNYNNYNNNGGQQQRPRRCKTLDDPLSVMMNAMDAGLDMDFDGNDNIMFGNNHHQGMSQQQQQQQPLKRRKSEPLISTFWDDDPNNLGEEDGGHDEEDDHMGMNNNMGGGGGMSMNNNNNNNMGGGGNQMNQNMMNHTFLAAAQEAFASINRLKELMSGAGGGGGGGGGMGNNMARSMNWMGGMMGGGGGNNNNSMRGGGGGQSQQQQNMMMRQRQRQQQQQMQQQGGGQWQQQGGGQRQQQMQMQGQRRQQTQQQQRGGGRGINHIVQTKEPSPNKGYRRAASGGSAHSAPADLLMGDIGDEDDSLSPHSNAPQAQAPSSSSGGATKPKASSKKSAKSKKSSKTLSPSSTSSEPKTVTPTVVPQIPLPKTADPELLKLSNTEVMAKLQAAMERTTNTQKLLQEWDRANGLPKSHSQTMVNSSRSRKQLTDGVILKKWNGAPLLNFGTEGESGAAEGGGGGSGGGASGGVSGGVQGSGKKKGAAKTTASRLNKALP